jgi:hypothetical protein
MILRLSVFVVGRLHSGRLKKLGFVSKGRRLRKLSLLGMQSGLGPALPILLRIILRLSIEKCC